MRRPFAILNLQISEFCHVSVVWVKMTFKMAAVRHVGFSKLGFSSSNSNLCMRAIVPSHSKFQLNRTIWSRAIAKKWFSIWRLSAILNLWISEFLSRFNFLQDSGEFPCAICRSGVGVNSIECSQCKLWVHKKCSGLSGRLVADAEFVCQRCQGSGVARGLRGVRAAPGGTC